MKTPAVDAASISTVRVFEEAIGVIVAFDSFPFQPAKPCAQSIIRFLVASVCKGDKNCQLNPWKIT